jgi:hypothetical protein
MIRKALGVSNPSGSTKESRRVVNERPGVLYRNHINPSPSSSTALKRYFHKDYVNFGRGVLYRNFAGQGCYKETIYSLLGNEI